MGLFDKIKAGLKKTRENISNQINSMLHAFTKIDEDLFEELEEALITADIGVDTTLKIIDQLRKDVRQGRITQPEESRARLVEIIGGMMEEDVAAIITVSMPEIKPVRVAMSEDERLKNAHANLSFHHYTKESEEKLRGFAITPAAGKQLKEACLELEKEGK